MALFVPRDRKSLFRQFLLGMYDAVVITDPNGHVIEVNPRAEEHFGYTSDEVLDQPISVFIPGLTPKVVQRIRHGIEDDRHIVIDANGLRKSGERIACEVAVSCIDLMDPGDLVFTIRNVERRRMMLNSLRARANAFKHSQSALFCCDDKGRFTECNDAFLELFGIDSEEDARKLSFDDLMGDDPLPENFRKAVAGERTVSGIVAEDDSEDDEELEIVLAPSRIDRKVNGVVGSILKL